MLIRIQLNVFFTISYTTALAAMGALSVRRPWFGLHVPVCPNCQVCSFIWICFCFCGVFEFGRDCDQDRNMRWLPDSLATSKWEQMKTGKPAIEAVGWMDSEQKMKGSREFCLCVCVCVSPLMLQVLLFNPLTLSSFHLLTCLPLFSHTLLCVYVCERICLYLMCFLQPE